MTLINALPFDGVAIGSSTWREFQRRHLALLRGISASDGLVYTEAEAGLRVARLNATTVQVTSGSGWANGVAFWNESAKNLAVAAAHATYNRYDMVAVRVNMIDKNASLVVKQGTPAATPVSPAMDKSSAPYYEVPLAHLTVAAGQGVTVVQDWREFISNANGIHRYVRNAGSAVLYPGDIVIWSSFNPWDVTTTASVGHVNTAGVMASTVAPGDYGLMTVYGVGLIHLNITSGPGTRVGTSTVERRADETPTNWIATLLESGQPGSTVKCWVDTTQLMERVVTLTRDNQESTTLTTFNYVNGMNTSLAMRWGGAVQITMRGIATYSGAVGPTVQFAAAIDAQESLGHISGNANVDYRGFFSFTHIFDNIAAGNHPAGVKWRVSADGNTGYLRGDVLTAICQIRIL